MTNLSDVGDSRGTNRPSRPVRGGPTREDVWTLLSVFGFTALLMTFGQPAREALVLALVGLGCVRLLTSAGPALAAVRRSIARALDGDRDGGEKTP